jgi:hypothetical protein
VYEFDAPDVTFTWSTQGCDAGEQWLTAEARLGDDPDWSRELRVSPIYVTLAPPLVPPESVEIAPHSDDWVYSWNLYASSGDVLGRFFTQTNGTLPPYSPDKGFAVTGVFWDAWLTQHEALGYPISRPFKVNGLDTQVFQRNALQVGPTGSAAVISTQNINVGVDAKAPQAPPDTPYEVAAGSDPWNKTFTFGGGAWRIVNGPYSAARVVDRSIVEATTKMLHDSRSKIHSYSIIYPDTLNWNAPDPPHQYWQDENGRCQGF